MLPPISVCSDAPSVPTMLRERTTMPRTRPMLRTMRQPGRSKAVVTSLGLIALMARMVTEESLGDEKANEIANAREVVERVDALDYLVAARRAENGRHQTSRLIGDRGGVERILLCPGREAREMSDHAAVAQLDLDPGAAWRSGIHQRAVADELNPLLHGKHLLILHAIEGMAGIERHRSIDQGDRDQVLKVHIRHRAVVDDARAILGQPHDHTIDGGGREIVVAAKRQQRIERRLDGIADGKRLDRRFGDVKATPETGGHLF